MDDSQFVVWREKIAPLIYDWFAHHNLPWPTQACRFGSVVEDLTYKTRYRVYYSEQTDDTEPQKLIVATADVCKPGVASAEVVSSWTDFSKSPYLKEQKVIFHPGEVNKIREIPAYPHLVITHTDAPEVYVWNVDKQPTRSRAQMRGKGAADSVPDLLLTGHEDEALFPLATTAAGPAVASGGNDCNVLVWSLEDQITSLLSGSSGGSAGAKEAPRLASRSKLLGHTKAVEEVVFKPGTTQELASVGDDSSLLFWDCRSGSAPVQSVPNAHGAGQDVQCVDWSTLAEHYVATGAQDGSVKVWDVRHIKGPDDTIATLRCHTDAIIRLEWHPHCRGVLASGGDDKVVMLWRIDLDAAPGAHSNEPGKSTANATRGRKGAAAADRPRPKELIMQHAGHRRGKVVDFQWCPTVHWALMSVSDDSADEDVGGGSLQMWRPSELLYGDEQQVLEQLEKHRNWILNGRKDAAPKPTIIETPPQLGTASQPTTTAPTTQPPAAAPSTTQPTTTTTAGPAKEPTPPASVGARLPPPPAAGATSEQQQEQQQQPAAGADAGGGVDVDAVAAAAVAAVAGAVAQQGQDGAQPMQTNS